MYVPFLYVFVWHLTLRYAIVLPASVSWQDVGRVLIGRASKSALRPAEGRPEERCVSPTNPAEIRSGNPISGPEALLRNIV